MDLKEIGIISGIVLVSSAVFSALFFGGMPAAAIFFGLLGVPAAFIGYTWYRVRDAESSMEALGEIQGSKLERLLGRLKNLWNRLTRLQERYFWPIDEVRPEVQDYAESLEPHAVVRIENDQLFYEVQDEQAPSATWTEERRRGLDTLETDLALEFSNHLDDWSDNLDAELQRLEEAGRVDTWNLQRPDPLKDPASLGEVEARYRSYLEEAEETLHSWHQDTANTLRSVEEKQGIDVEPIWDDHEMVEDALERRDLPFAAALLRKVLDKMDEHLSGEFTDERTRMEEMAQRVRDLELADLVGHDTWQRVLDVHQRVQGLSSSAQLLEISELEGLLRDAMADIQERVIDELEQATSVQEGRQLPDELQDARDHQELVDGLPGLQEDLHAAVPAWTSKIRELAKMARRRSKLAEAIKLYPRVEDDIEEALEASGEVSATDLKVKDVDPFFRIFAAKHPEVATYDGEGTLTAAGQEAPR